MKTVSEMALEAGLAFESEEYPEIWMTYMNVGREEIERFAELVRADERKKWEGQTAVEIHEAVLDEREACAKVIDEMAEDMVREMEPSTAIAYVRSKAAAIRARGEMK